MPTPQEGHERAQKTAGRPPPQRQAEAVAALMKEHGEMNAGQTWCLISSKWLESWIDHTGSKAFWQYRPEGKMAANSSVPTPIDNTDIVQEPQEGEAKMGHGIVKVRLSVQEIRDFFYVPVAVWEALHGWYGGGPKIERGTKLAGVIEKRVKVDLHPVYLVLMSCKEEDGEADETGAEAVPHPKEATLREVLQKLAAEASGEEDKVENKGSKEGGEGDMELSDEEVSKESKLSVRLWYREEKKKTFPFEIGERVEACYKGKWYPGDLVDLPASDKYGRFNVLCDVDKDEANQPKTMVKVIRRQNPKEGEGEIIRQWKPITETHLDSELGILKLAAGGVLPLLVERKKSSGEWVKELQVKSFRDFEEGDQLDCEDTQHKFLPAVVKKVLEGKIYVHYTGYAERWDEWINATSRRLAPPGTKCGRVARDDDNGYSSSRWGSGGGAAKGSVGLRNLGNTCFMNSTLQCMNATPSLTNFFVDGEYMAQINPDAYKSHGRIAKEYGNLVKEMWSERPHVVTPSGFKAAIGDFAPRFSGYQQQDSQELLACLLEGLHEDLNRVRKKPYDPNPAIGNGSDDEKIAALAWNKYRAREDSVVIDNIYGQIRSQVVCPECKKFSVKFDPCGILQVPFPSVNTMTQRVTLVRHDVTQPREIMAVSVPKAGNATDLAEAVAAAGSVAANRLVVCEIYQGRVYKVFPSHHPISSILANDRIYAFECPELAGEAEAAVLKVKHESSHSSFGVPFCIAVPVGEGGSVKAGVVEKIVLNATRANWEGGLDNSSSEGKSSSQNAAPFKVTYKTGWSETTEALEADADIEVSGDTEVKLVWESKADYVPSEIVKHQSYIDAGDEEGGEKEKVTLQGCLQAFTKEEVLSIGNEYRCPTCKKMQRGKKKLDLWRLPNILIIQLKRFQYTRAWRDKITTYVDYPLEGLDMSPWTKAEDQKRNAIYDLYAVSCHGGGLGGGHYWAYAKNLVDKNWYNLNDSSSGKMNPSAVRTREAYLLFYAKRGFDGTRAAKEAFEK